MDPLELGTLAAIVLVLFLWGPQKIPELARMVAQARKEFDSASREFQKLSTSIQNGTNPLLTPTTPPPQAAPAPALPPSPTKTGDQLLIEAARRLGISTVGKTREEIQEEIISMAQRPGHSGSAPPPSKTGDPST